MFLGVIVNCVAVLIGGVAGLVLRGGLKPRYQELVIQAMGMSVFFVGASGAIERINDPQAHAVLFIISLAVGSLFGEWVNIEYWLERLGKRIELMTEKNGSDGSDGTIAKGFVSASLLFCIGSMAILGSFQSGIEHNHTILFVKSIIDGICAIILASTLGAGVVLAGLTLLIYQGALTFFAGFLQPLVTENMMLEISIVGNIIIACMGFDLMGIKKIRYGNMFPAIFIPPIYFALLHFIVN